jgi:ribosomal protein S18 acetylase RimI-like enzyme
MGLSMDPVELARLEEGRQARGVADLARECEPIAGGMMSYEGPDSWANEACGLGLDGPVSGDDLDRLVDWYAQRRVPAKIEVVAHAHESLIAGLSARGFVIEHFENIYATDLVQGEDLYARHDIKEIDGVAIEQLPTDDSRDWREYAEVGDRCFTAKFEADGSPTRMSEETYSLIERMIRHKRTHCFLARDLGSGRIVGVAAMEIVPRLCCLFAGAVLPEFRNRGIQSRLIIERLATGQAAGCEVGVTHTKPGIPTERNCRRLGMVLGYTKVVLTNGPVKQT